MSESKVRRLGIVKKVEDGEPIVIELSLKTVRRLANLANQSQGAMAVAQQAVNVANAMDAKWKEAIGTEVTERDIEVPPTWAMNLDIDKNQITLSPPPPE